MSKYFFRALRAKEVEVRNDKISVTDIKKKNPDGTFSPDGRKYKLPLLLYKNARVDQNILDRYVGPLNWSRTHSVRDGKCFCAVSLRDPKTNDWVTKEDVGSASGGFERDKSLASDSFKRACACWGVGRELYSVPYDFGLEFVERDGNTISDAPFSIERTPDGDFVCNDRFVVQEIKFNSVKELIYIKLLNMTTLSEHEFKMEWRDQTPWTDADVTNPWIAKAVIKEGDE